MPACYTQGGVESFFTETSLLKLGCVLYACACYTPINTVFTSAATIKKYPNKTNSILKVNTSYVIKMP